MDKADLGTYYQRARTSADIRKPKWFDSADRRANPKRS